jgi:hypothetical protein
MASFKELFTPLFIFIALSVFIGGLAIMQVLDRMFEGTKYRDGVRIFALGIIINIIILIFLVMSFSKVKLQYGIVGPRGNKGYKGYDGKDGSLQICKPKIFNVGDKKANDRINSYIDIKPPLLNEDDY